MKKLISMLLVLVLVLGMAPAVYAANPTGSCGIGVNWVFDPESGVLTIRGSGAMKDFSSAYDVPWHDYREQVTSAVIEPGITAIGENNFYGCKKMTSVSIPEGVTRIGKDAFRYCSILPSVTLPASLVTIDNYAFFHCYGLKNVTLPEKVESIGEYAFYECTGLEGIKFNEGLKTIGKYAFSSCSVLTAAMIPDTVTSVGSYAFAYCDSLTTLKLSDNMTSVANSLCYSADNLVSLKIGANTKSIGSSSFYYCQALKATKLPDTLESIGQNAFRYTGLEQIIIPESVTKVDVFPFMECKSLTRIAVLNPDLTFNSWYGGEHLGKAGTTTIYGYESTSSSADTYDTAYEYAYEFGYAFEYITSENLWKDYVAPAPDGEYAGATEENPFTDVYNPNEYYYEPVLWAYKNGITAGASATTFEPAGNCQRGQVVTFLHRAMDNPAPSIASSPFIDVSKAQYYYTPILWAFDVGITQGTDATHFSPENTVTRAQFVTFLWRAAGKPSPSAKASFSDVPSTEYYYDAVAWAVENSITMGTGNNRFSPNDTCKREQVVTFLYRFLAD